MVTTTGLNSEGRCPAVGTYGHSTEESSKQKRKKQHRQWSSQPVLMMTLRLIREDRALRIVIPPTDRNLL